MSWLVIVIVCLGLALILGVVRLGWAFNVLGAIVVLCLFSPFIMSFMSSLNAWVIILIAIAIGWWGFRFVVALVLGEEGAGNFIGHLSYDLFRTIARLFGILFLLPFRLVGGIVRRLAYRRT